MMKKLIFCLLMLTGAGMLNSCQQEDVANEVPASKGVTIRASLPDDAQSRVSLGETSESGGKSYTKLCWESDDVIKVKIGETEYTFTTTDPGKTTATFTCEELPSEHKLPQGSYTFTCGSAPTQNQNGIGSGIQMQATFNVEDVNGCTWDNVSLQFSATVALVEISLPITTAKVTLYNANTGARLAYTENKVFSDKKVYFALPHGTACKGFVLAEADDNTYVAAVGQKTLQKGKLYQINMTTSPTNVGTCGTSVKYLIDNNIVYVYGSGGISAEAFKQNNPITPKTVIILDGVNSIGNYAFDKSALESVVISGSVTTIGTEAFHMCTSLSNVTIADGTELLTINNQAFAGGANGCSVIIWRTTAPALLGEKQFGNNVSNYQIYVPSTANSSYMNNGWEYYNNNNQIKFTL